MLSPRATYRFQFNEHFRFADALALVPYLHALGISNIYASPLFQARTHSAHGYDVCDFGRLNPEIGTEADLEQLVAALRERGMGLVVDIVPNHMGIGTPENAWWWNVLKNGRASRFAGHFDINWKTTDPELRGKILLPVLGDSCHCILEKGEFNIEKRNGEFVLSYFENLFPLAPGSMPQGISAEEISSSRAALKDLLEKQNYLLACQREGDARLNYRRFFAVSSLAGVRVEDETVFNDVHSLIQKWIANGWLDGLRVDHPDGLRDPETYLRRLRALAPDLWIVVEKILQLEEPLPRSWPVQGTTGYEFLNQVNGLFVDGAGEKALTDFYGEFTGEPTDYNPMVHDNKRLVLETLFITEVNRLVDLLAQIAARHAPVQNFTSEQIRKALIELAASFPVYRTYLRPEDQFIGQTDLAQIQTASETAKLRQPAVVPELFDFLAGMLRLQWRGDLENEFVARFQQLTSPAMAKGVEDTTFYCFNRFVSLNEVGGEPGKFGVSAEEFHGFCRFQQANWPRMMLASSTHDTKRSEDVRARMNVLSEIPGEWRAAVLRWSKLNERHRQNNFPDRNVEYLFYQTLVGAWPVSIERLLAYMEKASCEAKQHTDWNQRNAEYDGALKHFVNSTLADKQFTDDLEKFIALLTEAAQINSLAQTLLKLTAPGVPDIYQGNEIWDFSLVDPDNRRPVDFALRQRLLAESKNLSAEEVWKRRDEGLPKLWLIQKTLALRARRESAFLENYEPLSACGAKANHIIAFMRGGNVITVVPRLIMKLKNDRADTMLKLPAGEWRNEFTGDKFAGDVAVRDLFQEFPVALLAGKEKK
jgi:(1->4)-alpha-D-glucan 1-alpha-D-glucosylmutase